MSAINLILLRFKTSLSQIAVKESISFDSLVHQLAEDEFKHTLAKIESYQPKTIITLGQPVYRYFIKKAGLKFKPLREQFGIPLDISLNNRPYILLPCVHNRTFYRWPLYKNGLGNRLQKYVDTHKIE